MSSLATLLTTHFTLNTTTQLKLNHPTSPPPSTSKLVQTAIALLREHETYIRLNPLVTAVTAVPPKESKVDVAALLREFESDETKTDDDEDAKDWTHYSITDSLPYPLGLPGTQDLKYAVALKDLADGMESLVLAPAGVTILGNVVLEVREGDAGEETLWLRECARVRCWWGMAWYIRGTMGQSHERLHEGFRGLWESRVEGGGRV